MIKTERLVLRRAQMTDLGDLHKVFSSAVAMQYWDSLPYTDIVQTEHLLSGMVHADHNISDDFVIVCAGHVIGKAGCWRIGEIGFILHPDYWGKGLAYEALNAVIPHNFETLPADRLLADVDPRNAASLRLLARLGFVETGRANATIKVGSDWCDSVYLELTKDRFRAT